MFAVLVVGGWMFVFWGLGVWVELLLLVYWFLLVVSVVFVVSRLCLLGFGWVCFWVGWWVLCVWVVYFVGLGFGVGCCYVVCFTFLICVVGITCC